jgi:endonuclease/exonuclease/phosphatase family metal-dependent hydrolase
MRDVVAATATVVALVVAGAVVALGLTRATEGHPTTGLRAAAPDSSPSPWPGAGRRSPTPSGTPAVTPSPMLPTARSSVCVPLHQDAHLTVVTFNIHSARAQDGSVELGSIADALAGWHPDVVLLQEVDRGRRWTGRMDMPSLLADRLGMTWTFGVNVRRSRSNEYGTAILSRYPILHSRNIPLPAPPGTQQRGLLHATIDADGLLLSVYGTHLENTSPPARLRQIRTVEPILAADPRPEIFGGDLNAAPGSPVVTSTRTLLTDTWRAVGRGPGATVPARDPRTRIDYLLYRDGSGVRIEPQSVRVLPRVVSDHRAVGATYRLSTRNTPVCVPDLSAQPGR